MARRLLFRGVVIVVGVIVVRAVAPDIKRYVKISRM